MIASESRPVSGFAAVTVAGPIRLVLEQGGADALEITAEDNLLPLVQSEVQGRPAVPRLRAAREPQPHPRGRVPGDGGRRSATSRPRGRPSVEMDGIDAARLGVRLSGAAIGSASGTVGALALEVSGASRWTAAELRSREVSADVSGASYGLVARRRIAGRQRQWRVGPGVRRGPDRGADRLRRQRPAPHRQLREADEVGVGRDADRVRLARAS